MRTRALIHIFLPALVLFGGGISEAATSSRWQNSAGYRSAELTVPSTGRAGFTLMPASATGVQFSNVLAESRAMVNANLLNGSGVALGDYDGDGLCDIYLCDLGGHNVLYRNLGHFKFEDVTRAAGVDCPNQTSTGAVFADLNGDGQLDLLVTSMGGPNACFINEGHGHFTNVTQTAGLVSRLGSTSMALADIDGNGTLDLYVANYGATSILRSGGALNVTTGPDGKPIVRGRYAQRIKVIDGMMYELGEPDVLYLNDGKGKFTPVSWTGGAFRDEKNQPLTAAPWDQGLSVLFRDLNLDGFPDIYVCNDAFTPDRCWINDGHGIFHALDPIALRQTSYFSMGADFADIDRDGLDDFIVVDMQSKYHPLLLTQKGNMHPQPRSPGRLADQFQIRRNTLFHNRGDGTYAEMANFAGLASTDWSWSCIFLDVDLDGWEDLIVANGFAYNADDLDTQERVKKMGRLSVEDSRKNIRLFPRLDTPNVAFRNQHDLTFKETGTEWGFNSKQISNGMALADLDNDGDLDVVVNSLNGPALIYRNESAAPRIAVRLRGRPGNTQGIGARIKVLGAAVPQSQEMICGGRYMSGDDAMRVFATGAASNLTIEVTWRSGAQSRVAAARPNFIYELEEPAPPPTARPTAAPAPASLFRDVSAVLGHSHHENAFDDFAQQPLLPRQLSQLGPGVAWFDLNGDGRDDLIIGAGKGGQAALFLNDGAGGFVALKANSNSPGILAERDQTTILGWTPAPGSNQLLVGSANYEERKTNGESVLRYAFRNGGLEKIQGLPESEWSVGALCLGDIDGDGNLDLFVGGRVKPGRYPEPVSPKIYRNHDGRLEFDPEASRPLQNLGLITGACFSDLNGDGRPDLLLATEWGPIRIFLNQQGHFEEATRLLGLARFLGWWNGIATGDFDGDGRLDIVAANWGLNSAYQASDEHPARIYFGDLRGAGSVDLFEAYDDASLGIVPWRNLEAVGPLFPFIREKFSTHMAYASAPLAGILGPRLKQMTELRANLLSSMLFLNRGDHFEAVQLPFEAQITPAFGVCVGDLDGDGNEDVFLSQNFFDTRSDVPRVDAGRGLWLRGDGRGGFSAVPGHVSGIKIYGEQRGAALCDYDQDGRVDLVVTQNGTETKLYHNESAHPGLRVRLLGPPGNPTGVGAAIRLHFGAVVGPMREVRAGSGYWSQDSAVLVMGTPEPPTQITIRWPGGKITSLPVPAGAREISVNVAGELKGSQPGSPN